MKKGSKKAKRKHLKKARKNAGFRAVSPAVGVSLVADQAEAERPDLHLAVQEMAPVLEGFEEASLARTKTHWLFGEWHEILALDIQSLSTNPERDRFALLFASASQQLGKHEQARKYTRMALDWGCPPRVVAQVLIAGVHNTLGRAAALKRDEPRMAHHFNASVAGISTKETALVSHARSVREMARMGLLPQAASLVDKGIQIAADEKQASHQKAISLEILSKEVEQLRREFASVSQKQRTSDVTAQLLDDKEGRAVKNIYSSRAYAFYQDISVASQQKDLPPFILLDTKSLPRSGLHYMKNSLARVLENNFSFCEWYQEPGCCKKMPCELTGYAEQCRKSQTSRLRMVKSHDFELNDPIYQSLYSLRRIILIRDPLYLLTSYFTLDQLTRYRSELKQHAINLEKIWLSHEPEVLASAYQIMDQCFISPGSAMLADWLSKKSEYIIAFLKKWVFPIVDDPQSFSQIVSYEKINLFIESILGELREFLPEETKQRIDDFSRNSANRFRIRQDPYYSPSGELANYLHENSSAFAEAAKNIVLADRSGILKPE